MAPTHARTQYRSTAAETATPAQLIMMLYDGLLARIDAATTALSDQPGDLRTAHDALVRAQMILDELRLALDHERGGPIADDLATLYAYCGEQLMAANLAKDPTGLPNVRTMLASLRDAWHQIATGGHAHPST